MSEQQIHVIFATSAGATCGFSLYGHKETDASQIYQAEIPVSFKQAFMYAAYWHGSPQSWLEWDPLYQQTPYATLDRMEEGARLTFNRRLGASKDGKAVYNIMAENGEPLFNGVVVKRADRIPQTKYFLGIPYLA